MRPTTNHIQAAILRAVAVQAGTDPTDREKPILVVEDIRSVDWASATFVGARHEFDLRIMGDHAAVARAVDRLVEGLAERDIPIAGQIVAEIGVILSNETKRSINMGGISLSVNALTIVD